MQVLLKIRKVIRGIGKRLPLPDTSPPLWGVGWKKDSLDRVAVDRAVELSGPYFSFGSAISVKASGYCRACARPAALRATVGIPGSGLSYGEQLSSKHTTPEHAPELNTASKGLSFASPLGWALLGLIVAIIVFW